MGDVSSHRAVPELSSVEDLVSFVQERSAQRIGIDGVDGVGKTTLAVNLAERLSYPLVSLDDYLDRNKGGFVEHLSYSALSHELDSRDRFVVEGDCLLQVLARLPMELHLLVYLKRVQYGVWTDERECEIEGDIEEFIAKEKGLVARIAGTPPESQTVDLSDEIIRYHYSYRPQNRAHVTYIRNDC